MATKQTLHEDPKPRAAPFMANPSEPAPERPADERAPAPAPEAKAAVEPAATAKILAAGDANTIGSPDIFLHERFAGGAQGSARVRQVWLDGTKRGYIIAEGSQLGYFELDEGMDRVAAADAVKSAYDRVAVIV